MPLTLDDIMDFMRRDKEERVSEREKDKQEIKEMISSGVKAEVTAAIQPIQERQLQVEHSQADMLSQFKVVLEEVKVIKEQFTELKAGSNSGFPVLAPSRQRPTQGQQEQVENTMRQHTGIAGSSRGTDEEDVKVREIISLARRTVGLHKIDKDDLKRMRLEHFGGAQTEEEEMMLAVMEYLKCELKMDSDTIKKMEIEKIFVPAREDPQCLYVTYKHETSVSMIYERTRCMRKGSRILNYIPRQFYDRFRTVSDFEYKLRKEDESIQTRVRMGFKDLELHKKFRGVAGKWERVALPEGLPPVNLSSSPSQAVSLSPAPGRPGQDDRRGEKRGRGSTGSQNGQSTHKSARSEEESEANEALEKESEIERMRKDRNEAWRESVEAAHLVGKATISPIKEGEGLRKNPDLGAVVSVTGTPFKQNPSLDYAESPILSKSSRKITGQV